MTQAHKTLMIRKWNWPRRCRLVFLMGMTLVLWYGFGTVPTRSDQCQFGSVAHAQSKADEQLAQLMKRKLEAAQKILEGLALANFDAIVNNAETLIFVSRQAAFRVLPTPEYELHSNEFRRVASELADKAREKNLDGATLKYVDLTLTCVKCHKHVRDRRGARLHEPIPSKIANARVPETSVCE